MPQIILLSFRLMPGAELGAGAVFKIRKKRKGKGQNSMFFMNLK